MNSVRTLSFEKGGSDVTKAAAPCLEVEGIGVRAGRGEISSSDTSKDDVGGPDEEGASEYASAASKSSSRNTYLFIGTSPVASKPLTEFRMVAACT